MVEAESGSSTTKTGPCGASIYYKVLHHVDILGPNGWFRHRFHRLASAGSGRGLLPGPDPKR